MLIFGLLVIKWGVCCVLVGGVELVCWLFCVVDLVLEFLVGFGIVILVGC